MDGKKRYIAIILFLLICLMVFTFATTNDEVLEGNGSNIQEITDNGNSEKEDEKEETKSEEKEESQKEENKSNSTNSNSTKKDLEANADKENLDGTGEVDNSAYDKALEAVKKLERLLTDVQAYIARDLVEEVKNVDQYKELMERVEDAEDAINAEELVAKLEQMVKDAAKKRDITDAKDFRDDKVTDAVNKIDGENLEAIKENLLDCIEELSKILEDNTNPNIAGIKNGKYTNLDEVRLTITDENEVATKVTKDGKKIDFAEKFTEEGTYEITVVDAAFNDVTKTFTIDRTNPELNIIRAVGENPGICVSDKNPVTTVFKSDKNEYKISAQKDTNGYWNCNTIGHFEKGEYTVTAKDAAGNITTGKVTVTDPADEIAPEISLLGEENILLEVGDVYNDSGVKVIDNKDGETILTNPVKIEFYNLNNKFINEVTTVNTSVIGKYVLTYQTKDAAGNESNKVQRKITIYDKVIKNANDLKELFSSFGNIKNKVVILKKDINMSGITDWKPVMGVDSYTFTLEGNGHKISNLVYETDKQYAGLFFEGMDSGDVTIKNLTIENSKIKSIAPLNKNGIGSYVGLIGGYIDSINSVNINNVHIINSEVNSTDYAGAFLGWTAGYNTQNDGPVDGIVNIINCSVKGTKVIAGGSAGLATGHAGTNPGTYTTIKNFVAEDNIIKGERVDKTGTIIGTANVGEVILDNIEYKNNTVFDVENSTKLVGRFVPAETGKLTHIVDDEKEYADAIINALSGQVIKLGKDLEFMDQNTTIAKGKTLTLDLNKYTIDGKSTKNETTSLFTVKNGASLNIIGNGTITYEAGNPDTDWGGEGQKEFPGYANNTIRNEGKLVIDGASIFNTTPSGGATFVIDNYSGADLTIEDGIIQQVGGATAIRMFASSPTVNTKVTINGGKISGSAAIWLQLPSTDTTVAPRAELIINGGTFNSVKETYSLYTYSYGNSHANTSITITGGTFNHDVQFGYNAKNFYDDFKTLSVTGGTFNSYLGKWTENHTWIDIEKPTNN